MVVGMGFNGWMCLDVGLVSLKVDFGTRNGFGRSRGRRLVLYPSMGPDNFVTGERSHSTSSASFQVVSLESTVPRSPHRASRLTEHRNPAAAVSRTSKGRPRHCCGIGVEWEVNEQAGVLTAPTLAFHRSNAVTRGRNKAASALESWQFRSYFTFRFTVFSGVQ
jgi:hypothetical protein